MDRKPLVTASVACLLVLAGCTGLPGGAADTATDDAATPGETPAPGQTTETTTGPATAPSTDATTGPSAGTADGAATATTDGGDATPTATTGAAATSTVTRTDAPTQTQMESPTPTETATESWSEPRRPNKPLQNKMNESGENRIRSVELVGGTGSSAEGYSSVTLEITADTAMPRVDPAEHGTVRGEPFFLVYANGSLTDGSRFSYANGSLVERSAFLDQRENGTYTLTVPAEAFRERGVEEGRVDLMVVLMDKDSEWDDVYGVETIPVDYAPAE